MLGGVIHEKRGTSRTLDAKSSRGKWRATRRSLPLFDWRVLFSDAIRFFDFAICLTAGVISEILYHVIILKSASDIERGLFVGGLSGLIVVSLNYRGALYSFPALFHIRRQVKELNQAWLKAWFVLLVGAFLLKNTAEFSRGAALLTFALGLVGLISLRIVSYLVATKLARQGGLLNQRIVIVGATDTARELIDRLRGEGRENR